MSQEENKVADLPQQEAQQDKDAINEQVNLIIDHYSKKLAQTELELAITKSELEMLKKEKGIE